MHYTCSYRCMCMHVRVQGKLFMSHKKSSQLPSQITSPNVFKRLDISISKHNDRSFTLRWSSP